MSDLSEREKKLIEALQKYEDAFDDLFGQCCSNPIKNAWGKPVNMTKLNKAHNVGFKLLRDLKS